MTSSPSPTAQAINNHAFELSSAEVLKRIPTDAEWVLIGEGSHGTKEFYETRAIITKDLIENRGFNAVAVEAGESFLLLFNAHSCVTMENVHVQILLCHCLQCAAPADFPDAFRANLWVRGLSEDRSADEALSDFKVHLMYHLPILRPLLSRGNAQVTKVRLTVMTVITDQC